MRQVLKHLDQHHPIGFPKDGDRLRLEKANPIAPQTRGILDLEHRQLQRRSRQREVS